MRRAAIVLVLDVTRDDLRFPAGGNVAAANAVQVTLQSLSWQVHQVETQVQRREQAGHRTLGGYAWGAAHSNPMARRPMVVSFAD